MTIEEIADEMRKLKKGHPSNVLSVVCCWCGEENIYDQYVELEDYNKLLKLADVMLDYLKRKKAAHDY